MLFYKTFTDHRKEILILNPNLIFNLISSKNGNNLKKNILCHYILYQIPTFRYSAISQFQNRPVLVYKLGNFSF